VTRVKYIAGTIVNGERRSFDPAKDTAGLLEAANDIPELRAVLVDPIVSAMAGDSHKNAETRRGLQPLVDFARERGIALIGITHFTKGTQGRDPIERITGSLAFGAIPRVVWGAVKGDDEDAVRKLVRIASNIGKGGGGFEYLLAQDLLPDSDFTAQRVVWGKRLEGSALELLENPQKQSQKFTARGLLEEMLADGPMPVKDIQAAAAAHGISWRTVTRVKEDMPNIGAKKIGAAWWWEKVEAGF
jgi:putative DNA primase/helicase